jgi:hypothetical protein
VSECDNRNDTREQKKWGVGGAAPPEDEVGVGRRDDGPVLALGRQVLQRIEEHLMTTTMIDDDDR